MNDVMVVQRNSFTLRGAEPDQIEDLFDMLTDALSDLEGTNDQLRDTSVAIDAHEMTVEITATAVGDSYDEAESTADSCIRSAIHATGGITKDWTKTQKESELACA